MQETGKPQHSMHISARVYGEFFSCFKDLATDSRGH